MPKKFRRLPARENYYIQEITGYRCSQYSYRAQIPHSDAVLGCEAHPDIFSGLISSSLLPVRPRGLCSAFCAFWIHRCVGVGELAIRSYIT